MDDTITYGRSVVTIAEQLFGKNEEMTQEEKVAGAQKIYDAVLNAFPQLRSFMISAQRMASEKGYVETILGRRRHIPDMMLPEFEFVPMKGYVNPDIDPLDINTLQDKNAIPERIVNQLRQEFKGYKYFGQIVKRIRELSEDGIKVINNRPKITEASRQCVNCVDYDTEILTLDGWKTYDSVSVGDKILAYSMDTHEIVEDTVSDVHIYPEDTKVWIFDTPTFSSVSTLEHRWVVGDSDEIPKIKTTQDIVRHKWPDYPILRVADNSFADHKEFSDNQLKILGWFFTDGNRGGPHYSIHLYQSTRRSKNKQVYLDMLAALADENIDITDACRDEEYHEIYLKQTDFTKWIWKTFPDRVPSFDFISKLSQRQSEVLLRAMLQGDGTGVDGEGHNLPNSRVSLLCRNKSECDSFQYLCFRAGYASNSTCIDMSTKKYPSNSILYPSMNNIPSSNGTYYEVCVLRIQRAHIYPHHKYEDSVYGVWCVTTGTGTWVARRKGKVYITGNSVVQGSAADMTKMAILALDRNEEWKRIGGRLLTPVHDELIAEVPMDDWEKGGEILSEMMCQAGDFLPFPIKCDVETMLRWYGMEFPCPYPMPEGKSIHDISSFSQDEIKWVQYHLVEMEYILPTYKDEDGNKPIGDAAHGVNGVISEEMNKCIYDYINNYQISESDFIEHIHNKVYYGT